MRIVFFGSFPDYQVQLANALAESDEVTRILMASTLQEDYRGNLHSKVICVSPAFKKPLLHPLNFRLIVQRFQAISRFKPDVIHLQIGGKVIIWPIFLYCKVVKRYPLVTTFHDAKIHLGEESAWAQFLLHFIRKNSDQLMVHGEKMRALMVREYDLPDSNVHSILYAEHGIDPFLKHVPEEVKEDEHMVLFFGRIYAYKGLEYLIKAEPLITKEVPNAKIVVAGEGADFSKYARLIGTRKDNFVIKNYFIPYQGGAKLFQSCSLVVLPYVEASQSGVILTAYGFKKPVEVTDVGSLSEIVDDGRTGFIVQPRDPEALARVIVKLLKNPELRKDMGEKAFREIPCAKSAGRLMT